MADFRVDMRDIKFVLNEHIGWANICEMPKYKEAGCDADTLNDMIDQAYKMAKEVLAPINVKADRDGCTLDKGQVYVTDY